MKSYPWIGLVLVALSLLILGFFNPDHFHFPRCPFLSLTGFKCPGCGSQRAIHYLLHGEVSKAASLNLLFLPGMIYASIGFLLSSLNVPGWPIIQQKWYGTTAAQIAFVIIVLFWIGRNLV